jgi:hypothetical protein
LAQLIGGLVLARPSVASSGALVGDPPAMEVAPVAGASDRAQAQAKQRSLATWVTAALPVAAIVVFSAAAWGALALLSPSPWIFPDELLYVEIAKSLADGGLPAIRETTTADYGLLYSLIVASVFALTPDAETAYTAAKVLNAFVMSLAAVPAYFLAHRFVQRRSALAVAAFSVWLPSMVYVGTLMTEVALYPAFLTSLLAVTLAVERPTAARQALALCSIALVFLVKPFGVVLLGVYCGSILLYVLLGSTTGKRRARLGAYKLTWILVGFAAVGGLGLGFAESGDPAALLGIYAQTVSNIDALGTVRWFAGNLSALTLYVTAIPVAATIFVIARAFSRRSSRAHALYAAVTMAAVAGVLVVVAGFGSTGEPSAAGFTLSATQLRERNFFLVAPLLLIGLAIWIQDRDRRRRLFLGASAATVALVAAYPWGNVPVSAGPQNLAPVPWLLIADSNAWRGASAVAFTVLALALLKVTPWNRTGRLWVALAAVFSLTGVVAALVFANASSRTLGWGVGVERGWIDSAIPDGANAVVVWYEPGSGFAAPAERHRVVWVNEYFNDRVGTVYTIGGRMPYNLPEVRADVRGDGVVTVAEEPLRRRYVLTCGMPVAGTLVRRDATTGAGLYRTDGIVRLANGSPSVCPGDTSDDKS